MQNLTGKRVEVITADMVYRGTLVEIGETRVYIKADEGWITVPIDRVIDIREEKKIS